MARLDSMGRRQAGGVAALGARLQHLQRQQAAAQRSLSRRQHNPSASETGPDNAQLLSMNIDGWPPTGYMSSQLTTPQPLARHNATSLSVSESAAVELSVLQGRIGDIDRKVCSFRLCFCLCLRKII